MVISKIQGGLGNQLFQWAVARSYSIKHKCLARFDVSFYPTQNFRQLQLNEFNIEFNTLPHIFCRNILQSDSVIKIFDNFNYQELPYDVNQSIYLNGFWQSEKYFIDNEDAIRNELSPDIETLQRLEKIPSIHTNTVSLHIRRTDYTTSQGYHPVQPIEYFERGLDIIGEHDHIFIFSDDVKWCRENLKFNNMIFMDDYDLSDMEEMWIMSLCKNNIISNSSFSWWGAWLNKNKDKKVIAPTNWFGEHVNLSSLDIIPSSWIKI